VLDTNIIDNLRQAHGTETVLEKFVRMRAKDALAISTISIQELYEGTSTRLSTGTAGLRLW
jgi:predicted nucleic acid-binding protein